jgi:hypothetical protein
MANAFTYQVIKDTTEHAVIKLTGKFDGSGQEDNAARIQANTLYGAMDANNNLLINGNTAKPYYGVSTHRIWYDTVNGSGGDVELYWNATTPITMVFLSGNGEYDGAGNWVTMPNNAKGTPGCMGDIGLRTRGMVANSSYTIIMELRKHNEYYQRGQLNDPAAFNYGEYALKP